MRLGGEVQGRCRKTLSWVIGGLEDVEIIEDRKEGLGIPHLGRA